MNVHNLFPGVISDPLDEYPLECLAGVHQTCLESNIDKVVILTVNEVAGQWDVDVHSARMNNAEILLALELMKKNILERMTWK